MGVKTFHLIGLVYTFFFFLSVCSVLLQLVDIRRAIMSVCLVIWAHSLLFFPLLFSVLFNSFLCSPLLSLFLGPNPEYTNMPERGRDREKAIFSTNTTTMTKYPPSSHMTVYEHQN